MDLRVLRYFLTVAREQSFTKAAEQLHITQPTLSRQMAALEEELGTPLLDRRGHGITLTDQGLLLKRRALEILDLEHRIINEVKEGSTVVEGTVTIGCGEFAAVETLAEKEYLTKEDLLKLPLILPERQGVQSELVSWFGKEFEQVKVAFTSNLGTNAGIMAMQGLGYPVSIEGAPRYWRTDLLIQKPLYPEIKSNTVIAWRRNIPYAQAVECFIDEVNAFKA